MICIAVATEDQLSTQYLTRQPVMTRIDSKRHIQRYINVSIDLYVVALLSLFLSVLMLHSACAPPRFEKVLLCSSAAAASRWRVSYRAQALHNRGRSRPSSFFFLLLFYRHGLFLIAERHSPQNTPEILHASSVAPWGPTPNPYWKQNLVRAE